MANLLTKRPNSQVGQAAMQSLKQRLTSVHDLTASGLSVLYDKVEAAELPAEMKDEIMETMDNLSLQQETALEVSAKPSSLHNLPPYLTTLDWQKLEQSHLLDNMRIICERLKKLGIKKLKEDTKKTAIALLLHLHVTVHKHSLPCPWRIYGLADDFVQCFAHIEVGTTVAPLRLYPTSPTGLKKEWIKQSYGDEEPSMSSLSLAAFYPKIPLRSTSALLQGQPPANLKHLVKSGSSSSVGGDSLVEKLENFMDKYTDRIDSQHLHSGRRSFTPIADNTPAIPLQNTAGTAAVLPLANKPATALALPGPPVVANQAAVQPVPSTPAPTKVATLEEFENQAFQKKAEKAGKGFKRPAAAVKTVKAVAKDKVFGCLRCRGNVKGCATCWNPSFAGQRFSSRQEWQDFQRKKTGKK